MPKNLDVERARLRPTTRVGLTRGQASQTSRMALLLGPALVAGVAYLDPGNVASNMTAGAIFGYLLVWVVVAGNVMAWLVQYLSAKLGIVTGQSLPELLGSRLHHRVGRIAYWLQAELVAMATDVAEIIGGAIALNLLFDLPLLWGGLITGAVSVVLLAYQSRRGARAFEIVIIGLLLIIGIGFCAGIVVSPPDPGGVLSGLVPRFEGTQSILLATSILGATIMPHAIYAHSALARDRFHAPGPVTSGPGRILTLLRATRWDVTIAMALAGTVNVVMLLLAASSLSGAADTDSIEGAYAALHDGLGPVVATLFAVGLLASGLASSAVGAYAGSEIMAGLLHVRVSPITRRAVTIIPALIVLGVGADPTWALVLSQVVLSFGIPFALVPLVWLTTRRDLLGSFRNRMPTTIAGVITAALLIVLNAVLLWLVVTGE